MINIKEDDLDDLDKFNPDYSDLRTIQNTKIVDLAKEALGTSKMRAMIAAGDERTLIATREHELVDNKKIINGRLYLGPIDYKIKNGNIESEAKPEPDHVLDGLMAAKAAILAHIDDLGVQLAEATQTHRLINITLSKLKK